MRPTIRGVQLLESFENDFKGLPDNIKAEAKKRIKMLIESPLPKKLRFHSLSDYSPTVYTIDVTSNKAYKASLIIQDGVAILRRIGTHKQIDRRSI